MDNFRRLKAKYLECMASLDGDIRLTKQQRADLKFAQYLIRTKKDNDQ